jgi:retron-type reverse transcriptase
VGIDQDTIAMYEERLSGNLYILWNRMSSGNYFPPPVLEVEISKDDGKKRKLGIPTVNDRVAQTPKEPIFLLSRIFVKLFECTNKNVLYLYPKRKNATQNIVDVCITRLMPCRE